MRTVIIPLLVIILLLGFGGNIYQYFGNSEEVKRLKEEIKQREMLVEAMKKCITNLEEIEKERLEKIEVLKENIEYVNNDLLTNEAKIDSLKNKNYSTDEAIKSLETYSNNFLNAPKSADTDRAIGGLPPACSNSANS